MTIVSPWGILIVTLQGRERGCGHYNRMAPHSLRTHGNRWALLIQGLLNGPHLPVLLENCGWSLAKETDFREYLKDIASSKILPILREALETNHYKQKLEEEKYSFLSTKEIFRASMNLAYTKYDWLKKSL